MADVEQHPYERYAYLLEDIAERVDAATKFLSIDPAWPLVRSAASELRGSLELLLLSGLATHADLLGKAENQLAGLDRKGARRLVREVNPDWWPHPILDDQFDSQGRRHWRDRPDDDWLREAEWDGAHSRTSNILHSKNPFAANQLNLANSHSQMTRLVSRLICLLNKHTVTFEQSLVLGQIGPPEARPRCIVTPFEFTQSSEG